MKVKTIALTFKCEKFVRADAKKLRGYFASRFGEFDLVHHHINDKFFYRFPLIQYKILNRAPLVLGINEGADLLQRIHEGIYHLRIGQKDYEIIEKTISLKTDDFGISGNVSTYLFSYPWLALNEKNYDKYLRLGSQAKKKKLLEKILVGNILSMSKGLGYTVPAPVEAKIINIKEVETSLKGNPMLGFLGTFSVNFEIPDYWGIGKSVSRGFGTVKRIDKQ